MSVLDRRVKKVTGHIDVDVRSTGLDASTDPPELDDDLLPPARLLQSLAPGGRLDLSAHNEPPLFDGGDVRVGLDEGADVGEGHRVGQLEQEGRRCREEEGELHGGCEDWLLSRYF